MSSGISSDVYAQRAAAKQWASSISPAFLNCLASPQRFNVDYSSCLMMYLNLTTGRLPNAYFLYSEQTASSGGTEPPDACLVFSGLANTSLPDSPLQSTMQNCLMSEEIIDVSQCPFNPSVYSASTPDQVPVAKLFGTVSSSMNNIAALYDGLKAEIEAAFHTFNKTFYQSAQQMRVELFTADGDMLHDFFDCVFLGPYTRVDMLPCDLDGKLECPFYARDELGGMTRDFTACYGAVMFGDENLPFTCGSQARRAIIKYFFRFLLLLLLLCLFLHFTENDENEMLFGMYGRDYSFSTKVLDSQVTALLYAKVQELRNNMTNPASYGCLNKISGKCSPEACTRENGYSPCIDMDWAISASQVSQLLLKDMLQYMDEYYAFVMQVTKNTR